MQFKASNTPKLWLYALVLLSSGISVQNKSILCSKTKECFVPAPESLSSSISIRKKSIMYSKTLEIVLFPSDCIYGLKLASPFICWLDCFTACGDPKLIKLVPLLLRNLKSLTLSFFLSASSFALFLPFVVLCFHCLSALLAHSPAFSPIILFN